jgi:hypothetical protein
LSLRPLGYEPSELPNCSTPRCSGNVSACGPHGQNPSQWPVRERPHDSLARRRGCTAQKYSSTTKTYSSKSMGIVAPQARTLPIGARAYCLQAGGCGFVRRHAAWWSRSCGSASPGSRPHGQDSSWRCATTTVRRQLTLRVSMHLSGHRTTVLCDPKLGSGRCGHGEARLPRAGEVSGAAGGEVDC